MSAAANPLDQKSDFFTRGLEAADPDVFSAIQVAIGKPAPDLFLLAARQLKASPAACTVVEDSVVGVAAAVAA